MGKKIPKAEHLGEHQFRPGQSGNPSGRPKLPEDLKKARRLNQIAVGRIINEYMNLSITELKFELEDESTSALEAMIGKIIIEAHKVGDYSRVNFLFDRMIGKVTEKVEHKMPKPTVIKLIGEDAVMVLGQSEEKEEE